MFGCDYLAEERRFLERNCRDGRIVGQIVLLAHGLVLDERAILLKQASVIALCCVSIDLNFPKSNGYSPNDLGTLHSNFQQEADPLGLKDPEWVVRLL